MTDPELIGHKQREEFYSEIHRRLIRGDPLAPSDLANNLLEDLIRQLKIRSYSATKNTDFIWDAAVTALLDYAEHPSKYKPSKSNLLTYLSLCGYRDLLNIIAKEQRRTNHQTSLESVELLKEDGNIIEGVEEDITEYLVSPEEKNKILDRIASEFPDKIDRDLLELIINGERKTATYSKILGIQEINTIEQRKIVKRHKDRIIKRLERFRNKLNGKQ